MTFPYRINVNIPNAPNDPADDQPLMKQNYANIAGYLQVDHVAAGTDPGAGFHKQVTFFSRNIPAPILDAVRGVGFTASANTLGGNATNSATLVSQQFYRNQNGIFPVVGVRAFANISRVIGANPTPQTINNAFNVNSVNRTVTGTYLVVLAALATNSVVFSVICTAAGNAGSVVANYTITGAGAFTINFSAGNNTAFDPNGFSFIVLET